VAKNKNGLQLEGLATGRSEVKPPPAVLSIAQHPKGILERQESPKTTPSQLSRNFLKAAAWDNDLFKYPPGD
jgi:hypothetical protein